MPWKNDTATAEQQTFLYAVRDQLALALETGRPAIAADMLLQLAGCMLEAVWNEQGRPQANWDADVREKVFEGLEAEQVNVIMGATVRAAGLEARSLLRSDAERSAYDHAATLHFILGLCIGEVSPRLCEALAALVELQRQTQKRTEGGQKSGRSRVEWHAEAKARFEKILARHPWLEDQPATRVADKMLDGWTTKASRVPLVILVRELLKVRKEQLSWTATN